MERLGIRVPDLADDVPVGSPGWQRQRAAWKDSDQPPVWVEGVEERFEVVLVGAPTVEENERAARFPGGRPDARPRSPRDRIPVLPRTRQGRQHLLHPLAQMLECRRQDQLLAEASRILVHGESWAEGRDFE
jgi:hypothetical protein